MKKGFGKFCIIVLVVAAIIVAAYFVLRIDAIDRKLTEWFGTTQVGEAVEQGLLYVDSIQEENISAPYIYEHEGQLLLVNGESDIATTIDITPPDVNISYIAEKMNVTELLRTNRYSCLSEDGKKLMIRLDINNVPHLFMCDIEQGGATLISANVDSFAFVGDIAVYATGYSRANKLYVYENGESRVISENMQAWLYPQRRAVAILRNDGVFEVLDGVSGELKKQAENVEEYYHTPQLDVRSTTNKAVDSADDIHVSSVWYVRIGGREASIQDGAVTMLSDGEASSCVNDAAYISKTGERVYRYSASRKELRIEIGEGAGSHLFSALGDIERVFLFDENLDIFIVANNRGIYFTDALASGKQQETVCLAEFNGDMKIYKKNPTMIRNFLDVQAVSAGEYYIISLTRGSFVLNKERSESWLNRFSSYVYGVAHVDVQLGSAEYSSTIRDEAITYTYNALDLPPSRRIGKIRGIYEYEEVDTDENNDSYSYRYGGYKGQLRQLLKGVVYAAYYADGTVRSVSYITDGEVRSEDMLLSSSLSAGQKDIQLLAYYEGVAIYARDRGETEYMCYTIDNDGNLVETDGELIVSFGYVCDVG